MNHPVFYMAIAASLFASLGVMFLATALNNERGADAASAAMLGVCLIFIAIVLLVLAILKWMVTT